MTEIIPNVEKERHTSLGSRESPKQEDPKEAHSKTIIIKIQKVNDKKKIFKVAGEKQIVSHKGAPIRLSTDFSTKTLQARRYWHEIFKMMKNEDLQSRLL